MSRIRSIHPGLFTDEAFMAASAHARILVLGLWCEAWDDGVFERKPLTLKARIFPVDSVDVPALLSELECLGFFKSFEANGKPYSALRNFRKYQRPKKPNRSGVLPSELRTYVGLTEDGSEPVPNQSGNGGEKFPQMEDGGGRMEKDSPSLRSGAAAPEKKPKPAKRSRARTAMAPDRQPTTVDAGHAKEAGMSPDVFRTEWRKFRDHHLSHGNLMADWPAAWRKWCGNWPGFRKPSASSFRPQPRGLLSQVLQGNYSDASDQDQSFSAYTDGPTIDVSPGRDDERLRAEGDGLGDAGGTVAYLRPAGGFGRAFG